MLELLPEIKLIVLCGTGDYFSHPVNLAYNEPAVDIGDQYELAITELAPRKCEQKHASGDVICTLKGERWVYADVPDIVTFIKLNGDDAFTFSDVTMNGTMIGGGHLGKLTVIEKKSS